jgi:hypothetical protein
MPISSSGGGGEVFWWISKNNMLGSMSRSCLPRDLPWLNCTSEEVLEERRVLNILDEMVVKIYFANIGQVGSGNLKCIILSAMSHRRLTCAHIGICS